MPLTFKIDHEKRFVQIDPDGAVTLGAWVAPTGRSSSSSRGRVRWNGWAAGARP